MPLSAATGTKHMHTTTTDPEKPRAQADASQAQAQEEGRRAETEAPAQEVLRGHTMPTAAEKSWNDKADTGHGRVSRSKRAAAQEARRALAPERQEGTGYEVVAEPAVKPKARAAKKSARRGRDD